MLTATSSIQQDQLSGHAVILMLCHQCQLLSLDLISDGPFFFFLLRLMSKNECFFVGRISTHSDITLAVLSG